jgi:hypothetical protein
MSFSRTLFVAAGMLTLLAAGASAQSAANQCSQQCAGALNQAMCVQACVEERRKGRRESRQINPSPPTINVPNTFELKGYDGLGGGAGGGRNG